MRRSDYAIVPVELLTREAQTEARSRASELYPLGDMFGGKLFGFSEPGLDAVYSIAEDYNVDEVGAFVVWLAFLGTSALFVFQRATEMDPDVGPEERFESIRTILLDRRSLHDHLLSQPQSIIGQTLRGIADSLAYEPHSYVFSYFVFEDMTRDQFLEWDAQFKLLSEPSRLGLGAGEYDQSVQDVVLDLGLTDGYATPDFDISHYSCAYVTWASIAAASWGNAEQSRRTKDMILSLEIKLQAAWNTSETLGRRIDEIIGGDESDVDAHAVLVGFSQALESVRGVVSATIPSRDQAFFDALRETSRIDEKIEVVDRRLLLMERYVERKRALARQQLERFAKVALYVIGAADVLGTVLSLLVGDLDPIWRITWFLGGLATAIACGLALWWFWGRSSEGLRSAGRY